MWEDNVQFYSKYKTFIYENASDDIFSEMTAILFREMG